MSSSIVTDPAIKIEVNALEPGTLICPLEHYGSLHLTPGFGYYFKTCRKGDPEAKAVTVNQSAVRALADASEITGLPRGNFEVWEITKAEFEAFPRN